MSATARAFPTLFAAEQSLRLAHIAEALGVPILVVTANLQRASCAHLTFGLEAQIDRAGLASALHKQCEHRTTVIPNISVHPGLSIWSGALVGRDIRFMIGTPLTDTLGRHAGSISVLTSRAGVSGQAVCIDKLKALGHRFIAQLV